MRKLSLDKTWELCLKQWKWIAGQVEKGNKDCVAQLKYQWFEVHNFCPNDLCGFCFFCERNEQSKSTVGCDNCPGRKVDKTFGCRNSQYNYSTEPLAFYAKLLELNKIRLAKKKKAKK